MARQDILDLPIDQCALLFATVSRYFSLNELERKSFESFKQRFGQKVSKSELDINDVLALATPLAAEGID